MRVSTRLQNLGRYLFLRSNFFPLSLSHDFFLSLPLRLTVFFLKQYKKVRSIYLIRGFAKKEAILGLSDIDLMIIYHSGEDDLATIARIKTILARVRLIFPGSLAPSREIGILTKEGLEKYSIDRYWYAFRLAEGFLTWKLLFGEDILPGIKRVGSVESMRESIILELNLYWGLLVDSFRIDEKVPGFIRNYQCLKGICEICRIYLLVCKGTMTINRMETLEKMDRVDYPQWKETKEDLLCCIRNNFFKLDLFTENIFQFAQPMISKVLDTIEGLPVCAEGTKNVSFNTSLSLRDFLPEKLLSDIQEQIGSFSKQWFREIRGVYLVPQVEFSYNHSELDDYYNRLKFSQMIKTSGRSLGNLDDAEFFPVYLVIHARQGLPDALINDLLLLIDKLRTSVEIYPYLSTGSIAFPLIKNYKQDIKLIKTLLNDPVFFYFSSKKSFRISVEEDGGQERCQEMRISPLVFNDAQKYMEFLDFQLKDTSLVRTCIPGFYKVFLTALRSKIFLETFAQGEPRIYITPMEIFEWAYLEYPQHQEWLKRFYGQLMLNWEGHYSDSPLFFSKALDLLKGQKDQKPAVDPNAKISVIIITADRKKEIVECLDSLLLQSRIPDEVVIIDNGVKEFVDDVVADYIKNLNIRHFHKENKGIPTARNAGLEHATGDILVFIDDDCVAHRDWLEKLVEPFFEDSSIGIVGGYLSGIGRTNKIVERYYDFTLLTKFGLEN